MTGYAMNAARHTIRCLIVCNSPGELLATEALAERKVALDNTLEERVVTFSKGVETRAVRRYVLRDFFDAAEVKRSRSGEAKCFRIEFHTREGADHYWGDIVARLLRSIARESSAEARIESVT